MHHRNQVVNNAAVAPPLCLGAFAGIVNNVGVDVGQIGDYYIGKTGFGKTRRFSWQPLQGAMLADMHNCIGSKNIPDPVIIGVVVMGNGVVRAVVDSSRVFKESPWWLEPNEDVAVDESRDE